VRPITDSISSVQSLQLLIWCLLYGVFCGCFVALLARVQLDATRYQMEYPARLTALCNTLATKSKALEAETVRLGERKQKEQQQRQAVEAAAEAARRGEEGRAHQPADPSVPPPVLVPDQHVKRAAAKPPPAPSFGSNLRGGSVAAAPQKPLLVLGGDGVGVTAETVRSSAIATALLIICANRPDYLERTLDNVLKYHPRIGYSVIISEDGASDRVKGVIDRFRERINATPAPGGTELAGSRLYGQQQARKQTHGGSGVAVPVIHLHHPHYHEPAENGYFKLSKHFKYALSTVFDSTHTAYNNFKLGGLIPSFKEGGFKRVVILEEDIDIAPDFFEFFSAVAPLVDSDPNVLCASAWNDNGFKGLLHPDVGPSVPQLVRSDFFPGLGWMMTRDVWTELAPKWPRAYWDDWLREPKNRRGRHTIRPEVSRTFHFGTKGTSAGQYNSYLNSIELNKDFVPFTAVDLSYLGEQQWDNTYLAAVRSAREVTMSQFSGAVATAALNTEFRVVYTSFDGREGTSFPRVAAWAKCMDNIKANVPRTAYHGVVSVYKDGYRLHLVPKDFQ
jgi:hypothetical protein